MIKWLEGFFVEDKSKVAGVGVVILLIFVSLAVYSYSITMKNRNLQIELQKLTIQVQNPTVVENPKVVIKYVTRTITKTVEGEGQTLILETEKVIESDGGKTITPITGDNQSPEKNWTAGVSYDTNGDIGAIVTRRIYKTLSVGVIATPKTAGVCGTVRF